jgi:hypothetical protein
LAHHGKLVASRLPPRRQLLRFQLTHIDTGVTNSPVSRRSRAAPRLPVGEWSPIRPLAPHRPFWPFRTGTAHLWRLEPFGLAAEDFADRIRNLALLTVVAAKLRIDGANEFHDSRFLYIGAPQAWWSVGAESLLLARVRPGRAPRANCGWIDPGRGGPCNPRLIDAEEGPRRFATSSTNRRLPCTRPCPRSFCGLQRLPQL